jgi:tRNA dimethylallyltransferase
MESRVSIVAVVGPTGVGKTAFALKLAPVLGAEVVCADSRQVYRYLDIGTAKPGPEERRVCAHHLLDVADPDEPFDVADYCRLAHAAIEDVVSRGRAVVLCGGSGLYVRALLRGLFPGPKADPELRQRLLREGDGPTLHRRLAGCDPEAATRIHPNDVMRVVRALEVYELSGEPISRRQRVHGFAERRYDAMTIGLHRERGALREGIARRCREMVRDGLVEEVRDLWRRGYGPQLAPLRSLGYRHVGAHLEGKRTLADAVEEMTTDTCRYAKRQLTWFRNDPHVMWFHAHDEVEAALGAGRAFVARCGQ